MQQKVRKIDYPKNVEVGLNRRNAQGNNEIKQRRILTTMSPRLLQLKDR